ncbi:MAG: hypothetical protein WBC67_03400 [Candidatus Acidiferrales bacterium]
MAVYKTFSKRRLEQERAGKPVLFQYDHFPEAFRVQVVHIWTTALGSAVHRTWSSSTNTPSYTYWDLIAKTLSREMGVPCLGKPLDDPDTQCRHYLLTSDPDGVLDILELSFRVIDRAVRNLSHYDCQTAGITQSADDAIDELNQRLLEHGCGYQYVDGRIVRQDSQYLHKEAVEPTVSLLNDLGFHGAEEEFLNAFDHYRHGRGKEAIAESLKAFESTMKGICEARKWPFPPNATAKPLIDILFDKGIIPAELQTHFGALRSALESGLPTISNKTSRHGQGTTPKPLPDHFVPYALHLAASNIIFLVRAHRSLG